MHLMNTIVKKILAILVLAVISAGSGASARVEFKRGLEQISFIPKGQWITGVSVSFSQSNQDNYQFFIVEDMSGDA